MRLLYISGSGRSGSTLIERILHSSPDCAALGEFHCLWRLHPSEIACSCGAGFEGDAFWSGVMRSGGVDAADIGELRRLEPILSRSGYISRHGFSLAALAAQPEVRQFLDIQFAIFEAASKISGRNVVVDSSKAGPRAWLLACDSRTSIIHVYRNPTDVIASWRSRKFDKGLGREMQRLSVGQAMLDWWKVEYFARRIAKQRQVGMIDYAALCNNPRFMLTHALADAGLASVGDPQWLSEDKVQSGRDYHSLNGNPDRFDTGPIKIARRTVNWSTYDVGDRLTIQCAGAALSVFYKPPVPAGR